MAHETEKVASAGLTSNEVEQLVALLKHPDIKKAIEQVQKEENDK